MLDTVIGPKSDPEAIDRLLAFLSGLSLNGTLYIGYPLVVIGDQSRAVDAMLTCRDHGVIVFEFRRGAMLLPATQLASEVQQLRQAVSMALARSRKLTSGGRLIVEVRVITVDPSATAPLPETPAQPTVLQPPQQQGLPRFSLRRPSPEAPTEAPAPRRPHTDSGLVVGWYNLGATLANLPPIDAATLKFVDQAVQRLGASRPALGGTGLGKLAGPRAEVLAEIDSRIAILDQWQKAAAIEMPEGPQRIRGLAGSGKTVVLAWKAAYLHARQPNWRIALMFYGRTLYEPLRDMVRRFYFEHTQREPDWNRLRLQHAWGAKDRAGVYTEIAAHVGVASLGISEAKKRYRGSRIFEGACGEVLSAMATRYPDPLYDVALMDEAQDLPATFMEMVYRVTAPPKRIVWAYDDLQNLGVYRPTSPAELFGTNAAGLPNVRDLAHDEGDARADIILPVCYRNTPWALTTAHAIGLGVFRRPVGLERTGLLQFYDDPELWKDIGYVVEQGVVAPGEKVTLVRGAHSTPTYFTDLIQPQDAVQCFTFQNASEEAEWVADSILGNLENDGLTPHDVMIVSANPFLRAEDAMLLIKALTRRNIPVHYPTGDELFGTKPSVPIAIINRAKGNEAAMVYVVHAEHGAGLQDPVRRRNTLFTAITRSRAWVRVTGSGLSMVTIEEEMRQVAATGHRLVLTVPTVDELNRLPKLKRDVAAPRRRIRSTRSR